MKRVLFILSVLLSLGGQVCFAQKAWTLEQCIDYAIVHNITLKQKQNTVRQNELTLSTAKNSRLPNLSADATENFSFGRGLTEDNTYTRTNTSSTQFQLTTSVPLLTGNRIPNTIKRNKLNLEASTADLEKARDDVRVEIAQEYIQVVYDMEILAVANRQITIDSLQCVRLEEFLKNGKASPAQLSQQQATLAQSRLTATQAENSLHIDLLSLSQSLELPNPEGFAIQAPSGNIDGDTPIPQANDIYADAVSFKPAIQAEELRLKASEKSILVAKADLYPTLSASAGLGTNYYKTSGYVQDGFGKQLKDNFSQYIGLTLSIPIFNRLSTRNSIRSARIDMENQKLALENVKKSLYKEIQQVYYNTVASQAKYKSSIQAEKSSADAFELTQAKYENGKANITEFNEAKNNLLEAQSNLVEARYELLYQHTLIDFYRHGTMKM